LLAELTLRMSGRPSLRIRTPSELRMGFVRVLRFAESRSLAME
jgi:hypothetical protein